LIAPTTCNISPLRPYIDNRSCSRPRAVWANKIWLPLVTDKMAYDDARRVRRRGHGSDVSPIKNLARTQDAYGSQSYTRIRGGI